MRDAAYTELQQPHPHEAKASLTQQFQAATTLATERFARDNFAEILDGKPKLKRDDKVALPASVTAVQKVIDASLPSIRIEQLLMEVDQLTHFSRHFTPIQDHHARPPHFYRTLLAAIISQATNLGVVSMSVSVKDTTVDMLRHVLHDFVREETVKVANTEIVNRHHQLPRRIFFADHGEFTTADYEEIMNKASC